MIHAFTDEMALVERKADGRRFTVTWFAETLRITPKAAAYKIKTWQEEGWLIEERLAGTLNKKTWRFI